MIFMQLSLTASCDQLGNMKSIFAQKECSTAKEEQSSSNPNPLNPGCSAYRYAESVHNDNKF